jgi:hypothetical protein
MPRRSISRRMSSSIAAAAAIQAIAAACAPLRTALPTVPIPPTLAQTTIPTSLPATTIAPPNPYPTRLPPTWTPLPTIGLSARRAFLESILADPTCRLPCWATISVGTTSWQEARQLFERMGLWIIPEAGNGPSRGPYDVLLPLKGSAVFDVEQGVVHSVLVRNEATASQFNVRQVITQYGTPDFVLLGAFAWYPEPSVPFILVLLFPQLGFVARYEFEAQISGSTVVACPGTTAPTLHIRSLADPWTEGEIHSWYSGEGPPSAFLRPIEEVTTMDAPAFAGLFLEQDSEPCIESRVETW